MNKIYKNNQKKSEHSKTQGTSRNIRELSDRCLVPSWAHHNWSDLTKERFRKYRSWSQNLVIQPARGIRKVSHVFLECHVCTQPVGLQRALQLAQIQTIELLSNQRKMMQVVILWYIVNYIIQLLGCTVYLQNIREKVTSRWVAKDKRSNRFWILLILCSIKQTASCSLVHSGPG